MPSHLFSIVTILLVICIQLRKGFRSPNYFNFMFLNAYCIAVFSHGDFYTIIDLPEGTHEYKFYVDGNWVCDNKEV